MKNHEDVLAIVEELKKLYPEGLCSLQYPKPYELLFSVRLAAHFARFPTLESLAQADPAEVETYIHSTGFFRAKARDIVAASRMLVEQYGGRVPDTMEELLKLPGVGRKTANVIRGNIYHDPSVVVDTHVKRISRRTLPPEESNDFCHRMVLHGRAVCMARKPDCPNCTLRPWCDFYTKS